MSRPVRTKRSTSSRYSFASLQEALQQNGFRLLEHAYICGAELIVKAQRIA